MRFLVTRDPRPAAADASNLVVRRITAETIASFVRISGPGRFPVRPAPMMTVRETLVALGVPDADILQEAFVSRPGSEGRCDGRRAAARRHPVVFRRAGCTVDAHGQTVLSRGGCRRRPFECRAASAASARRRWYPAVWRWTCRMPSALPTGRAA
jgi:hypothetical protein